MPRKPPPPSLTAARDAIVGAGFEPDLRIVTDLPAGRLLIGVSWDDAIDDALHHVERASAVTLLELEHVRHLVAQRCAPALFDTEAVA